MNQLLQGLIISLFLSPLLLDAPLSPVRKKIPVPPGMVMIRDSFYMDQTEVTNGAWLEFLYFMGVRYRLCRKRPDDVRALYWDSMLLYKYSRKDSVRHFFNYLRHPTMREYPVLCITQDQAIQFCKWRTDMVYLRWLLDKHPDWEQKVLADSCPFGSGFNAEKYLKGQYLGFPVDTTVPVPVFTLPTQAQWMQMANLDTLANRAVLPDNKMPPKLPYAEEVRAPSFYPAPVRHRKPNKAGIYGLYGNAAEMVAETGIAMGGSWMDPTMEALGPKEYTTATEWMGFRCVCRLMRYGEYQAFIKKNSGYSWKGYF